MHLSRIGMVAVLAMAASAHAATPQDWVTTIDAATYGSTGTITFNDWGYKGPAGVGANDFQVGAGFNASNIGQIQHVVTKSPDWKTPDAPQSVLSDNFTVPHTYTNASMDGQVNFFGWAYTTPAGSTFSNMKIDKAGNYFVARNDMQFGYYDTFQYHDVTGANPDSSNPTYIGFQPYAISDAKGWCGSVLVTNPNGVSEMAGQVTFDFAFDAYLFGAQPGPGVVPATQIVPGFVMRSYGSYDVNVTTSGGINQHFTGSAVMNNTNPETGQLDPAFQNQVSFLGGGVVPKSVCVINDGTPNVQVVDCGAPGATVHTNVFGGYAFLLRADATRTLEFIAPDGHSLYVATDPGAYAGLAPVPLPAAGWLLGSGLVGLIGWGRRKQGNRTAV
jgi:hypothetical protein